MTVPAPRRQRVRGGLVLTAFGLLLMAGGVAGHAEAFGYPGEVTGSGEVVRARNHLYTIAFTTADGRRVEATTRARWGSGTGPRVRIAYEPDRPDDVRVRVLAKAVLGYLAAALGLFLAFNGVAHAVRRHP